MKKLILLLIGSGLLFSIACIAQKPENTYYYKISLDEIDKNIRSVNQRQFTNQQKMEYYSECFIDAPYVLQCEGDG